MYWSDRSGCSDHSNHQECSQISLGCDCNFCELDHWVSPPSMTWDCLLVIQSLLVHLCLFSLVVYPHWQCWQWSHSLSHIVVAFLLSFDVMKTVNCGTLVRMWHSLATQNGESTPWYWCCSVTHVRVWEVLQEAFHSPYHLSACPLALRIVRATCEMREAVVFWNAFISSESYVSLASPVHKSVPVGSASVLYRNIPGTCLML